MEPWFCIKCNDTKNPPEGGGLYCKMCELENRITILEKFLVQKSTLTKLTELSQEYGGYKELE